MNVLMRPLLSFSYCIVLCLAETTGASDAARNIVVIMADDFGYECVAANGGGDYHTPELDRLAATGARFTHCYVQPLCTPTRCQVMTGRYNVRNYVQFGRLDRDEITFGNLLQQAGFRICVVGKWQLGREDDSPHHFGFQESCLWQHTRRPPRYANPGLEVNGEPKDYSNGEYGPDIVVDYALDFITRHQDERFLLYYPMILPHSPYQPTPDSDAWDPELRGERRQNSPEHFAAMIQYVDKNVGRLVQHLEKLNLRQETLLIFLGDNGTGRGVQSKLDGQVMAGGKGKTTAAGMHVPLIVNWPGHVAPQVTSALVDSTDILPTILQAAGVQRDDEPVVDGVSFLPHLTQGADPVRKWVYSWYWPRPSSETEAEELVFDREYKLYRSGQFFELQSDPQERRPIALSQLTPEQHHAAAEFQKVLDKYEAVRPKSLDGEQPADATQPR